MNAELREVIKAEYELNRTKIEVLTKMMDMLLEYLALELMNIPPVPGSMKIVKKEVSK